MYNIAGDYLNQKVKDFALGLQPRFMEPVSHHIQDICQQSQMIFGVKSVHDSRIFVDIDQHLFQQIQSQITVSAKLVPEGPNDAVEDCVESAFIKGVKNVEVVFYQGLQETKEIGAYFGEGVKVSGDERQTGAENHIEQIREEIWSYDHP